MLKVSARSLENLSNGNEYSNTSGIVGHDLQKLLSL